MSAWKCGSGDVGVPALTFSRPPRIINITPVEIKGPKTTHIFQATMEMRYRLGGDTSPSKVGQGVEHVDYAVFEYCADVHNPRWRICARVFESDHYFKVHKK